MGDGKDYGFLFVLGGMCVDFYCFVNGVVLIVGIDY